MDIETKQLYDRLLAADWIDNVRDTEAQHKAFRVHALKLRKLEDPKEYGVYKLVIFSKLYRDLIRSGAMSPAELDVIVKMGQNFAVGALLPD
jgi:hypothetical protein